MQTPLEVLHHAILYDEDGEGTGAKPKRFSLGFFLKLCRVGSLRVLSVWT